jgi:hypothetical protein
VASLKEQGTGIISGSLCLRENGCELELEVFGRRLMARAEEDVIRRDYISRGLGLWPRSFATRELGRGTSLR